MALLELDRVEAFYGRSQALWGITLEVEPGEVVGLLGRNGMGKTTTLKAIMGLVRTRGRIAFAGEELTRLPAYKIPRLGIAYLPQGERLFPQLTLRENLLLGLGLGPNRRRGRRRVKPDSDSDIDIDLDEVLQHFPQLRGRLDQPAGTLSGGEQQMAALARALLARARLLLLDEPTEGLMPSLVRKVSELLREAKAEDEGRAILLAEQRVELALELCDRIYILERGRLSWSGRPGELTPEELQAHMGL